MENNKIILKKILTVLSVLILGALGSGLWDVFLKDFLFNVGGIFVKIVSQFHSGYVNSIYKNVGDTNSMLNSIPAMFIVLLIAFLPIFSVLWIETMFIRYRNSQPDKNQTLISNVNKFTSNLLLKSRRKSYIIILVITIPISFLYLDILITELTCINTRNHLEKSIEIIRPNISDKEYIESKSDLRQIDNLDKLNDFHEKISDFAARDSTTLHDFKYYGMKNIK